MKLDENNDYDITVECWAMLNEPGYAVVVMLKAFTTQSYHNPLEYHVETSTSSLQTFFKSYLKMHT